MRRNAKTRRTGFAMGISFQMVTVWRGGLAASTNTGGSGSMTLPFLFQSMEEGVERIMLDERARRGGHQVFLAPFPGQVGDLRQCARFFKELRCAWDDL